jgi:hypothetical protein
MFSISATLLKEYLTACSIMVEFQSPKTSVVISFALPSFSLSVALTIIATVLITVRLMAGRRVVQKALSPSHRSPYVSVAAMIIESAALYTIVGIFFIAFLVTGNPGQNILSPMMGQAMVRHRAQPYLLDNFNRCRFIMHRPQSDYRSSGGRTIICKRYIHSSHGTIYAIC